MTGAVAAASSDPPAAVEQWCASLAARQQFLARTGDDRGRTERSPGASASATRSTTRFCTSASRRPTVCSSIAASAQWEERAAGERAGDVAAELAVHFERGHDPARAVPHLSRRETMRCSASAHAEAIRLLERGLELLADAAGHAAAVAITSSRCR